MLHGKKRKGDTGRNEVMNITYAHVRTYVGQFYTGVLLYVVMPVSGSLISGWGTFQADVPSTRGLRYRPAFPGDSNNLPRWLTGRS